MADINTENKSAQFFSGTGANTIIFGRSINRLLITTSGSVSMSYDGVDFLPITAGTYEFNLRAAKLYFSGGGTYSAFGLAD